MLKKLLKHELYATGRILLPVYGLTIILSLVNRLLINIEWSNIAMNIVSTIMMVTYVLVTVATVIVTFVLIILRFYKNLMSDEGYLMFTLPVKPLHHINSKLISSVLWIFVSVIVVIFSLFILLANSDAMATFSNVWSMMILELKHLYGNTYYVIIIEFSLAILVSVIQQIMLIYVSIAVGHLFTGHKVLGSFGSYIAINTVVQIITTVIMLAVAYFSSTTIEELENLPHALCLLVIVLGIIFNTAYYLVTNYIFSNKLNLE